MRAPNLKSAQSNLKRGPRRGTVAHLRRKVPIGYNGAPQIRPQKYPFARTDPQTSLPASSLDTSDLWCQTASGSDPPFFHNALGRQTHRQTDARTHRPTDRPQESLITIGRCATTATRPKIPNTKTAYSILQIPDGHAWASLFHNSLWQRNRDPWRQISDMKWKILYNPGTLFVSFLGKFLGYIRWPSFLRC